MRILVLEDDSYRITIFVNKFHNHELVITENAYDAIEYLTTSTFDIIFLDHDLGKDNGSGSLVSSFLRESENNSNNNAHIIIHSWNMPAAYAMMSDLPGAILVPFASKEFYGIQLPQ